MPDPSHNETAGEPVILAPAGDRRLERAAARAKNRLPEFLDKLRAQPPGLRFFVKHAFERVDSPAHKHLWVRVSAIDGDVFVGTLASDPEGKVAESYGDPVRVPIAHIEDWAYDRGGKKTEGAFSDPVLNAIERERRPG